MNPKLNQLIREYDKSPVEFHATQYWNTYQKPILQCMENFQFDDLRSGKHPILGTFGFGDLIYPPSRKGPSIKRQLIESIRKHIKSAALMPYGIKLSDIREMAYRHCELIGAMTRSLPISRAPVCLFGNPQDVFTINKASYTMPYLGYYLRYCFANKHVGFSGKEIIVELGSGSGYQIEVIKKLYPGITVLCFDLPVQIYLCEEYLRHALSSHEIIGTETTMNWKDLSGVKPGGVHFFGNWQFPLLSGYKHDLFWNAASFGEMEPGAVRNYLRYIRTNAEYIYLMQARYGKQASQGASVETPIQLGDYQEMLRDYSMIEEQDAWRAQRRLSECGGYFEAVWRKSLS